MEIDELSLEEIWAIFRKNAPINQKIFKKAFTGINIFMNINEYLEGNYRDISKIGKINYRGHQYKREEIDTEFIQRERLMTNWIKDNMEGIELFKAKE